MPSTRKRAPASRASPAKAPARRKPASAAARRRRRRSRRGGLAARIGGGLPRLPVLDQRQRDILGLAVIACGVFMGFVLYGSGSPPAGGRAGHALALACGWLLGRARVLAPVALVLGGGVALMRPLLPAVRPLRT